MAYVPRPTPCFLDGLESAGERNGAKRWRSADRKRYYTWDGLHGENEVY